LQQYARVLGYSSGVGTMAMWTPQVYKTWRSGSGGALSLLMLAIQFPGSIATAAFLFTAGNDWTTVPTH
jgi:uncharacterized protein with PQ loop repeat